MRAVELTCVCGKRLKAAARLAGKRVQCPACGQALAIPALTTATAAGETREAKPAAASCCPYCQAEMAPADVLCIHCGYHKDRGVQLLTESTRILTDSPPRDFHVEDQGNRLNITRGPALKGGAAWAIGVLAIGLVVVGVVWLVHPIAASILLGLFVLIYPAAIYRFRLVVDHQRICVRHEPFFWANKTIPADDVEQLYCRKRRHFRRATQTVFYTYDVCVLTKGGRRRRIVSHLPVESHALYFEERIEQFLGITDRDVEESLVERYSWLIRSLIILTIAIAALIASLFIR